MRPRNPKSRKPRLSSNGGKQFRIKGVKGLEWLGPNLQLPQLFVELPFIITPTPNDTAYVLRNHNKGDQLSNCPKSASSFHFI